MNGLQVVRTMVGEGDTFYAPKPDQVTFSSSEPIFPNDLSKLLSGLAEYAAQSGSPSKGSSDEVVLDVEEGGFRCILLRLPNPKTKSILSPREIEIARLIAKGYPNKIIADILQISSWTVATHLRRIFAKLNTNSRAAVIARLKEDRVI